MMLQGHLLVATGGYLLIKAYPFTSAVTLTPSMALEFLLVCLGCLLPDIDHRESTIGKRLKVISYPLSILFGHRGAFHSLFACAGVLYVAYSVAIPAVQFVALGYLLHLLGDFLTPSGIPLFYPSSRRYRFMVVAQTNSLGETVLATGLLSLGVYMAFFLN